MQTVRGGKLRQVARQMAVVRLPRPGGVGAIGDSITSGSGSAARWGLLARDSWVAHLVKAGVPYTHNAAVPNQVTSDVAAQIPVVLCYRPRAVVILTGTNDVFEGLSLAGFAEAIEGMADEVIAGGATPILATLPPLDAPALPAFNLTLTAIARSAGLPLIDFHAALAVDGRYGPGLDRDGLHPSVKGAQVMARAAEPVVRAVLA